MILNTLDEKLKDAVLKIATRVQNFGARAWIVGGAVRDMLLGLQVKDVDIEVFGLPPKKLEEIISLDFSFDACGEAFGVLKIKGFNIDVALPRRESKRGIGHKGFLIESDPFISIPEAASRRDFTINTIYYDPITKTIEDPFKGREDLQNRVLRHVSEKFVEDPLRVLRGMQFVARFDLTVAKETLEICKSMTIEDLPKERLFSEWEKLMTKGLAISRALTFLRDTTWIRFFPELAQLIGCEQDAIWHPEGDVWAHTLLSMDAFARARVDNDYENLIVGLAVLCHDFGKTTTTFYDKQKQRLRSLGHDEAGVKPTLSFLKRLTNEERILKEVPPLVQCHMLPYALWKSNASDSAVRRLAVKVKRIDRLIRVAKADSLGRNFLSDEDYARAQESEELRWLSKAAERLELQKSIPKQIFQGRDLIALGFHPSKQFGVWLSKVYEAQLDGKFSDLPSAIKYFKTKIL